MVALKVVVAAAVALLAGEVKQALGGEPRGWGHSDRVRSWCDWRGSGPRFGADQQCCPGPGASAPALSRRAAQLRAIRSGLSLPARLLVALISTVPAAPCRSPLAPVSVRALS